MIVLTCRCVGVVAAMFRPDQGEIEVTKEDGTTCTADGIVVCADCYAAAAGDLNAFTGLVVANWIDRRSVLNLERVIEN